MYYARSSNPRVPIPPLTTDPARCIYVTHEGIHVTVYPEGSYCFITPNSQETFVSTNVSVTYAGSAARYGQPASDGTTPQPHDLSLTWGNQGASNGQYKKPWYDDVVDCYQPRENTTGSQCDYFPPLRVYCGEREWQLRGNR